MGLADDFFAAEMERCRLEDKIDNFLASVGYEHKKWTADPYDSSIEIFEIADEPTGALLSALWEMGFARAWTHPGIEKVRALERYHLPTHIVDGNG